MRRDGKSVEGINDLAGLSRSRPGLALALAIFMFSLAGIPPLAGFFGKVYVFLAAIDAHLYVLAVIGVLSSVVGAYYYLRIVKLMYFDEPAAASIARSGREMKAVLVLSALHGAVLLRLAGPPRRWRRRCRHGALHGMSRPTTCRPSFASSATSVSPVPATKPKRSLLPGRRRGPWFGRGRKAPGTAARAGAGYRPPAISMPR